MWKCTVKYGGGVTTIFTAATAHECRRAAFNFLDAVGAAGAFMVLLEHVL